MPVLRAPASGEMARAMLLMQRAVLLVAACRPTCRGRPSFGGAGALRFPLHQKGIEPHRACSFVPRATAHQHAERQVGHTTHCECLHVHNGLFQGGLGCEHHSGYVFLLCPGREFWLTRLGPMVLLRIAKEGAVFPPLWLSAGSYVSDTPSQSKHVRHPRLARSARSGVFGFPVAA